MTHFEMTRDEAKHLGRYLAAIRERLGAAHRWDLPGIDDALARARTKAPSPELAIAAIRAAQNPANRTPAVIGLDGAHWRASTPEVTTQPERGPWCGICGVARSRHADAGDHPFESPEDRDARAAAARAQAHPFPDLSPTHEPRLGGEGPLVPVAPERDVAAEARALVHPNGHLAPVHPLSQPVDHGKVREAMHRFRPGQPLTWGDS